MTGAVGFGSLPRGIYSTHLTLLLADIYNFNLSYHLQSIPLSHPSCLPLSLSL